VAKRLQSRRNLVQQLEDRRLLAGPELIAIRPDAGGLLRDGDTLNTAPSEFNLQFRAGANIDESSITADSIKLVRSGGDGTFDDGNEIDVALGYVGLENPGDTDPTNLQQIVFRPSSSAAFNATDPSTSFPDDIYQIQVFGSGGDVLTNLSGEAFNDGVNEFTTFRLDRGAQVVSVVPQPISYDPLSQASDEIVVFFDDQPLDPTQVVDPAYYRLVNTAGSPTASDDSTTLPESVTYDSTANRVTLKFSEAIPEGNYRLDIGQSGGDDSTTPIQVGTLNSSNGFAKNGYLGDAGGVSDDASDVDLYSLQLAAGSTLNVTVSPQAPGLNTRLRLVQMQGGVEVELESESAGADADNTLSYPVAVTGEYLLEITSEDGSTGSYLLDAAVAGNPISTDDDNSTFGTATGLGTLGAADVRITSNIRRQPIPLPPRAGSEDEPGHRQIQREAHIGARGTTPTLPAPVRVVRYYFPDILGTDTNGDPYINLITEKEKQIIREIFEIYAQLSGYEFIESSPGGDLMIGKGDFRAVSPGLGPNDGVAGLASGSFALANGAIYNQANRFFGDGFTDVMFHEIGHSLGLGHSYDIPSNMGSGVPNDVLPGDHDVVHLQRIVPPNSTDIDMYGFSLAESGRLRAETIAERLDTPSLLNTAMSLYRQVDGQWELIARNDQYFGADSFLELHLEPGDYAIGISSTGNTDYDPNVPDSGFGGTTDGAYDLQLSFEAQQDGVLRDADGTAFDGDADGTPGGVYSFWFQATDADTTIYVGKQTDTTPGPEGDGRLSSPYDTIEVALRQAARRIVVPLDGADSISEGETFVVDDGTNSVTFRFGTLGTDPVDISGASTAADVAAAIEAAVNDAKTAGRLNASVGVNVSTRIVQFSGINNLDIAGSPTLIATPNPVRILANGGEDGDIDTAFDNRPYLVGLDTSGNPLDDGAEFLVPQGANVMIDAGALFKMRRANLDVGSSSANVSRSNSSIQVLGTPERSVLFRSYHNDSFGGDSDGVGPGTSAGDFGGIVFRGDSDLDANGIYLNYVNHADINNGGGNVLVEANELPFAPIFVTDARPTLSFNRITNAKSPAISASPDAFEDSNGRIGPEITGNYLADNAINGLFIRVRTPLGGTIDKLDVSGRFDDTDIPHVLSQSLIISGAAGGPVLTPAGGLTARAAGRLVVDPGVVVKLDEARIEVERGAGALIAEGTENRPVIFTSISDDRYGGSGTFNSDPTSTPVPAPGDWGGLYFGQATSGSIDHALIAYGGGSTPIEGGAVPFNAIEIHQAEVRIANSTLQSNAGGGGGGIRNGRGAHADAAIYVRGAQPIIVDNTIVDNVGPAININANSMRSETQRDSGRSTGRSDRYSEFDDNKGPLVRLNELDGNSINGMQVRGELLTTETYWEDTDMVHVIAGEVVVGNHHTFSGLTLQSSNSESLIIKATNGSAGFTATGSPQEIIDRIGGTIHVLGTPGHPVVLTSLADDSVGAGFTPSGALNSNTNNSANPTSGAPGQWRGLLFDEWSNDRNVAIIREAENPLTNGNDVNSNIVAAQNLGVIAPDQKSGDENRRLGFVVRGYISPTSPDDVDVYSFNGTAGTEVWLDIDRTDPNLDAVVEIINASGTVLARSVRSGGPDPGNLNADTLTKNPLLGGDHYTQNFRDPGFRYTLPGTPGQTGTYFVRVRSNPDSLGDVTQISGESRGEYQLQVRLDQVQEFPGSTVRFADIRNAETGIDVRGLPARSLLIGEAGETNAANQTFDQAQQLVNLMETDMAALGVSGNIANEADADWYRFSLEQTGVQVIPGVNDSAGTIAVVLDLDYADKAVRADTTVAVFDQDGNLVFVGRESNVEDDRNASPDGSIDDLSRGSLGTKDAYIGPIHLTPGQDFYVAVMSDRLLPTALTGVFQANPANAGNGLVRLEPVNSVSRIVEDHLGFQGYSSRGIDIEPETPQGLFDINTLSGVGMNVRPFTLQDVALYVATDEPENDDSNRNSDHLYTVDPFQSSRWLTRVTDNGGINGGVNDVQDVVMRTDGRMYGYQRLNDNTSSVGALVNFDPETGNITVVGNDNINGQSPTPNTSSYSNQIQDNISRVRRADQFTTSDEVDALTFRRTGTTGPSAAPVPTYDVYYAVRESDTASKLYLASENGDASLRANDTSYGFRGDIQPADVSFQTYELTVRGTPPANGATPRTTIRIKSKIAGLAGAFDFEINPFRPDNTNADVDVFGNTIRLTLGGTGGPPITGAPSAQAIVDAINNHPVAGQRVTAVIYSGNADNRGNGAGGTPAITANATLDVAASDGAEGPLRGRVTGLSFSSFFGTGNLFGVTDAGEFIEVNRFSGDVLNRVDVAAALGIANLDFQGLSLGPQNVEDGIYRDTLFAVTSDGQLVALDTDGNTLPIFESGSRVIDVSGINGGGADAIGLAFSPLDFNLWHPTTLRGTDAGHGINLAEDGTRIPGDISELYDTPGSQRIFDQDEGGVSYQFGLEPWVQNQNTSSEHYLRYLPGVNAQYGILTTEYHADLSSNPAIVGDFGNGVQGSYNLPGGGYGTLETGEFDLDGSLPADRPTLYFSYFLETEGHNGSNLDSDDDDPFRDSARVFISTDDGNSWDLVASNNSRLSAADPSDFGGTAELPGFLSHLSDAGLNSGTPRPQSQQIVQELFDNTGQWRQARVDLSQYAGLSGLRLRLDFSSAGSVNDDSLGRIDSEYNPDNATDNAEFGEYVSTTNNARSIRSLDNQHQGFFVDDFIIGYAERGEMVTGTNGDAGLTNLYAGSSRTRDRDPNQFPDIVNGPYQLEIRRTDEHVVLTTVGPVVGSIFDTNDRHVDEATETASVSFEPTTFIPDVSPWSVTTDNPNTGTSSLQSGPVSPESESIFSLTRAELGSTTDTAGVIRFSYDVSSALNTHGLRFLIDGVPQRLVNDSGEEPVPDPTLASGATGYVTAEFTFGSGNPTFSWVYDFTEDEPAEGLNRAWIDNIQLLQGGTGLLADRNRERSQGNLILDSNLISGSSVRGINVQPGTTEAGGSVPHPGSTINFPQLNTQRLVPGVVIQNNVISGSSGIRFAGETNAVPQRPVPFGRLINNTLVGDDRTGTGIEIVGLASPTLMNNLITGFNTGIDDGGTGTVVRSNFFQDNANNGSTGSAAITAPAAAPLFLDADAGNYYLQGSSSAVDSSQNTEQERQNYLTFKTELGIPASPINAPLRDAFGQLRVDPNATDLGDRGALENTDAEAPYAVILNPFDNDAEGNDRDPSDTVIWVTDPLLENFTIFLGDGRGPNSPFEGTGVDGLTVDDPEDDAVSDQAIEISKNGTPLVQGVDYIVGYNELSGILRLTPLSTLWEPSSVYIINLDNTLIADRAGNRLRSNQRNGDTSFTVIVPDVEIDFGDAPSGYRTLLENNGPRHVIAESGLPLLGTTIDGDVDGNESLGADGDDLSGVGGDDDGLFVGTFDNMTTQTEGLILAHGATSPTSNAADVIAFLDRNDPAGAVLPIEVTGSGKLDVWLDLNIDGDFLDQGEKVISGLDVTDGVNQVRVFTPETATTGLTYARFRISEEGTFDPFGLAIGGEVEDYRVNIVDVAETLPEHDSYTVNEDEPLIVDGSMDSQPALIDNDDLPTDEFVHNLVVIDRPLVEGTTDTYETDHGTVRVDDAALGLFTYTPNSDYYGQDSFRYRVSKQRNDGPEADATASFATVTIDIAPVNDAPLAEDVDLVALEYQPGQSPANEPQEFLASELLAGALADADVMITESPWDESNQQDSLRVISITVESTDGTTTTIDASNQDAIGTSPFGTIWAEFDTELADPDDPTTFDRTFISKIYYQGDDYFNSDNLRDEADPRILDSFSFTIQDDGRSLDMDDNPVAGIPLTAEAEASVLVVPRNSDPVLGPELISTENDRYTDFYSDQGQQFPIPTEDTTLRIDTAFLLANDVPGPEVTAGEFAADDEIQGVNGNDGALEIIAASVDPQFGSFAPIDPDNPPAELLFTPAADVYGEIEFTYTVRDMGIDEELNGDRTVVPRTSTVTSTIFVEPVNDAPVAYDRSLEMTEAVEPAGPAILTFTAGQLLDGVSPVTDTPISTTSDSITVVDGNALIDGQTLVITDTSGKPTVVEFSTQTTASIGTDLLLTYTSAETADDIAANLASLLGTAGITGVAAGSTVTLTDTASIVVTELPAVPGDVAFDVGSPFDESEQTLRIVSFTTPAGNVTVASDFTGTETLDTSEGGVLTLNFVDGAFTEGTYQPAVDYNRLQPFAAFDQFTYGIEDDGKTTLPVASTTLDLPTESSLVEATVTITVEPANDAPFIETVGSVDVLEDPVDPSPGEALLPGVFTTVLPGPSTAEDELQDQATPTVAAIQVSDPNGVMADLPTVTLSGSTGDLTVFPNVDAVGEVVYVFTFEDDHPTNPQSTDVTVTVNVRPENDPPRFDPDVTGTSDQNGADDQYAVAKVIDPVTGEIIDGTITYTLKEDNTQTGGDDSEAYFIPLRRDPNASDYNRVGLLDVFVVGPANEANGIVDGGNQTLSLDTDALPSRSDLGGTLTPAFNSFGEFGVFYDPPQDYNSQIGGVDSFQYTVTDDGTSFVDGQLNADPRSATNFVRLVLNPVNDQPQFDVNLLPEDPTDPTGPLMSIEAPEDSAPTSIDNFAFGIEAGPPATAFDEVDVINGQVVEFSVTPLSFPESQMSDFFSEAPTISTDGTLNFQPAPDAFGSFDFRIVLSDKGLNDFDRGDLNESDAVTITIDVLPVNDPPVLLPGADVSFTIDEDTSVDIPSIGDSETTGLLDVFAVGPNNESLDLVPGGNQNLFLQEPTPIQSAFGGTIRRWEIGGQLVGLTYTPRPNFVGTDSFIYTVRDDGVTVDLGSDGTSRPDPRIASHTVSIQVDPINNPPQFSGPSSVTVAEDVGAVSVDNWATNVLAGPPTAIDELESQDLFFEITQIGGDDDLFASEPVAVINDEDNSATLQFEPAGDANGIATFEVQLFDIPTDGTSQESSSVRVFTLQITPVNDPPTFDPPNDPVIVPEDNGPYAEQWATNISPGPSDEVERGQTVRFEVTTPPDAEDLFQTLPTIGDDGILRFIPAANANGTVDLTVVAIDSGEESSDEVTLRLIIEAVNDTPQAVADQLETTEDAALIIPSTDLLANDIDPDIDNPFDTLTVVMPEEGLSLSGAEVLYDSATGRITYDPSTAVSLQALADGDSATDSFTYRVVDAAGEISNIVSVEVAIEGINDAPVALNDNPTLNPDGPTVVQVLANDSDIDGTIEPTSLDITLQPAFGSLAIDQGVVTYTAFGSFSEADTFRYRVADENGDFSNEATVTIAANAAPLARADQVATYLNEVIEFNVAVNDEDPDADPGAPDGGLDLGSIQIVTDPVNGSVVPLADGTVRYAPNDGFLGIDTFRYTIADSEGRTSSPGLVQVRVLASRLQNPDLNPDVNDDGDISPIDALLVINRIGRDGGDSIPVTGEDSGPPFYDVNGDQRITPLDALAVINELALRAAASGESEFVVAPFAGVSDDDSEESADGPLPAEAGSTVAASTDPIATFDTADATGQQAGDAVIDLLANGSNADDDEDRLEALDAAFGDLI
jgi:VCBS repeat-containing protein